MKRIAKILSLSLLLIFMVSPAYAIGGGAKETLEKFDHQAKTLLQGANGPSNKVADLVRTLLDYGELAEASLGKHWAERTQAEQKEFTDILRSLIEKNYVKHLRDHINYEVTYNTETRVPGGKVNVTTTLTTGTPPRQTETEVVYIMKRKGSSWVVVDVVTDGVSLTRNYRSQFGKIIAEKGYDELINKMKKKLSEE